MVTSVGIRFKWMGTVESESEKWERKVGEESER
jgi:hypothetical protein